MRLKDLYDSMTPDQRKALAVAAGIKPAYLYQIVTRHQGKRPSIELMQRLIKVNRKLTLRDLLQEFSKPGLTAPASQAESA